jgi:hypothetical protein
MKRIRVATAEEVESIKGVSDLDPSCIILALETNSGTPLAVVRTAIEVDPVHFPPDFPDRLKMVFMRDVETVLAAKGVDHYYFNILNTPETETYRDTMVHWGATPVSEAPETRFKKVL